MEMEPMKSSIKLMRQLLSLACATLAVVLLSACEQVGNKQLSSNSVVYCAEGSPETFNPQLVTSGTTIDATSNQIYNRLISFDRADNTISPALAKSWHVTRDGKMVTFYLRKNIAFHQTDYFVPSRTLNADDVLFSFNRILNPEHEFHSVSGGKYPFFQSVGFSELVDSIEKINDYTIRFKLKQANSSFLANLATDFAIILSAEYAQKLVNLKAKEQIDLFPIGTGPFKLKNYLSGAYIRYYKHENYWKNEVAINQLVFDITSSNTARLTKLLTKECDVISYPISLQQIKNHPHFSLDEVTSFNIGYLGFNTDKAPFNNIAVRQAIAHAIDIKAIIETVYSGLAEHATTVLPKNSWAYDDTIPQTTYSPIKAKQLLIEAGFPEGFEMDIWAMPVQRAYNPNALTMAKLIQANLNEIGIKVNIVSYEWTTFLRRLTLGEHDTVLLGWSADHPDPDNFLTPLLSCAAATTGSNRTLWCNQEYDALLQSALQTTNTSKRKRFYAQAQAIVANELPLIPIAHSKRFQARSKKVEGQLLNSFGGINFAEVVKK
jgi:cationic peptide transport system substrate-binding protein